MLFLASNGLTSAPLLAAVQTAAAGKRTAALVVTADPVFKEKNRHAARCMGELIQLGLSAEIFDIDCRPPAGLLGFDVVELMGGNPYYLLHSIREHQAEEVLRKLAEERLLIGWSAGALVLGPSLRLIDRYTPEMNLWGVRDLSALCLTGREILPHYSRYLRRFAHFEETCRAYEQETGCRVLRLNDGDGILAERGEERLIRGGLPA